MFCNKCGKEIGDNSNYCNYCGNKIKPEEKMEPKNEKSTNGTGFVILAFTCLILSGILIFQSMQDNKHKKEIEGEYFSIIKEGKEISPKIKKIESSSINTINTIKDLNAEISALSKKLDSLSSNAEKLKNKEKIESLMKELESYKDKEELKTLPNLNDIYTKILGFLESFKNSVDSDGPKEDSSDNEKLKNKEPAPETESKE